MSRVLRLWHGELPLQQAFWDWAVIGGLIVNLASSGGFLLLMMEDRSVLALIVGYGPSIPFNILVCVGVWRSADRFAGERRWANLARTVTIAGMLLLSVT